MKIIGINGSARKNGNTFIMLETVLALPKSLGFNTEIIQLYNKDIKSCTACFKCKDENTCILHDDFDYVFRKILECDAFILGSPVYSADISSKMKAFLERAGVVVAMNPGMLKHKVGASVAAVRRAGGMQAVDTMNHFLLNKEVIIPGSTYWNMAYGNAIGDVSSDEEGMRNMKNIGENIVWLLNKIHK